VGLIAALALALAAAPAAGEPILSLGVTDSAVTAATDSAGTLHAVWVTHDPSLVDTLTYCRIPAGGTACTPRILGGFPSVLGRPHMVIRRRDGALIVVVPGEAADTSDVTFVLVSTDGGATWNGPTIEGYGQFTIDDATLTLDGSAVDTVEAFTSRMSWQRVPLSGPPERRIVSLTPEPNGTDSGVVFDSYVGYLPDGRPMLVGEAPGNGGRIRFRILGAGADPYANASWSRWSAAPPLNRPDVIAAFGPNGIWAATVGSIIDGDKLEVWRFDGRRFVKPKSVGTIGGRATTNVLGAGVIRFAFAQDAGGRLHAVWLRTDICGAGRNCLLYRRNEPRDFWPPVVYPLPTGMERPNDITIAPDEGGSGWLVWRGVPLSGSPAYATPLVTPPHGSRVGSLRLGRSRRVTLPTHYGCIPPGGRYVARLLVSGRRSGVRIVSVRFSIDGALPRTDRRSPYRAAYTLTFPAGTRHVVQARVSYRRGGRLHRASVGRAIVMCP
jgi:hypothetical protein